MVTGGAGYIGSHAVLELLDAGYSLVVIDDLSNGHRELIPKGCEFIQCNAGDSASVNKILRSFRVKSVMHFAGSAIVEESVIKPLKYYENNTEVTRKLIDCCIKQNVHQFIFSSTAAVYGNPQKTLLTEDDTIAPVNPYGASKAITERMLTEVAATSQLRFIALRYFNVAGADHGNRIGQLTENSTHLIKAACETALGKRPYITIFGNNYDTRDGTCIRDYIHVSDLASVHVKALEYLELNTESRILNCGYGKGYSVREVLEIVQELTGEALSIRQGSRRAGDAAEVVADTARLRNLLNWNPAYNNLRKIVSDTLEWEALLTNKKACTYESVDHIN